MTDHVDYVTGRTQAYDYVDGLPEIAAGLLLLGGAALIRLWQDFERGDWLGGLLVVGAILLLVAGVLALQHLVQRLKSRITYPRTGYAIMRHDAEPQMQRLLWLLIIAVAVVALLFPRLNELPFGIGLFFAAILTYLGYRGKVWRFYLLAVGALIAGIVAALWRDEMPGTVIVFLATGCLMLISGAIVLLLYLRRHAAPTEDAT